MIPYGKSVDGLSNSSDSEIGIRYGPMACVDIEGLVLTASLVILELSQLECVILFI